MRRAPKLFAKQSDSLGWPEDKSFYVPDEALAHFRQGDRSRRARRGTVASTRGEIRRRAPGKGRHVAFNDERRTAVWMGRSPAEV